MELEHVRYFWNWTRFCDADTFNIWTKDHLDLTQCFQMLCLQIPLLSLIAIASSYYSGQYDGWTIRTFREKRVLRYRMFFVFLLAVLPAVRLITQTIYDFQSLHIINYSFTFIECIAWFMHFCYVSVLKNQLGSSLRGPVIMGSLWAMFYVVSFIRARSLYLVYMKAQTTGSTVALAFAALMIVVQTLYGITLIPSEDNTWTRSVVEAQDQEDLMVSSRLSQYSRFREDLDPHYIGAAMEDTSFVSRFFFLWVGRLINKGAKGLLQNVDDVFELPSELTSSSLHQKLKESMVQVSILDRLYLLKGLHKCFAWEFYSVGILRFTSDLCSAASPLLLHLLIDYIENPAIPVAYGYYYAIGIFFASMVGAACDIHFTFGIEIVNFKVQSALMCEIYRKILALSPSVFIKTSVGEVLNHITTDVNRIKDLCIIFHELWSIPVQLGVTLYLLYLQIGIAFLAGVVFAIILIPINKVIAVKIGEASVKMLSEKDKRVEIMSETIKGIRTIKLHVWEDYFVSKVLGIRVNEVRYLKIEKYLDAVCVYFWATTPVIIGVLTFVTFVLMGGNLTASTVFTTIALLNMLIGPLNIFPWVLNGIIESWVSLKRVDSFLKLEDQLRIEYYDGNIEDNEAVNIRDGSFSWTSEEAHISNINVSLEKGKLIGVCGTVGSGKTSLLSSIIYEIEKVGGEIAAADLSEGFGYVSQTPWIQQCTIRDNILFGKPYEAARYRNVMEVCALIDDLNVFPNGDFEVVGESGSTLSGGQKARISLARAVYQDNSIYIFDDILSAVDAPVAHHIFNRCIREYLRGKTRIIATHLVKYLMSSDLVLLMKDGRIIQQGAPNEVLHDVIISERMSSDDIETPAVQDEKQQASPKKGIRNSISETSEIEKEVSATGTVSLTVYSSYWKAVGNILAFLIVLSVVLMQVSQHAVDWWISMWVSVGSDSNKNSTYYLNYVESRLTEAGKSDIYYFLVVYTILGIANSVIAIIRSFIFAYGGICAAVATHENLLSSIIRAQVTFFDVSPLGRILNRFSADTYTIDEDLPFMVNALLADFFSLVGTLCMIIYGVPWLCLLLAPIIPLYQWLQNRYRLTSRELKRLTSTSLSPLYSHVSETISGVSTIRAFRQTSRFNRENEEKVDAQQKCTLSSTAASLWLDIRLQGISVLIIGGVCIISVLQRHYDVAHSGFVGLATSYALSLTSKLSGVVNVFSETEKEMVAMERICEYINNPTSENFECSVRVPLPFSWPCHGVVVFNEVNLKYRDDLAHSIKNVTFETIPGEKIGVVGRTAAGKSSLFVALFRLTEITSGFVSIDGINIAHVPLKKLRSKITIIPQDPFIFAGTVRENLDPLTEYEDLVIWNAIKKCNVRPLVDKLGGLDATLRSEGANLSVGERQLLCLVRAVLRSTKIVCIDEATANIDEETDKLIQEVIRKAFNSSTVFTIAHRMKTVMDSDSLPCHIYQLEPSIPNFHRRLVLQSLVSSIHQLQSKLPDSASEICATLILSQTLNFIL